MAVAPAKSSIKPQQPNTAAQPTQPKTSVADDTEGKDNAPAQYVNIMLQCHRDPAYGNKNTYAQHTYAVNHQCDDEALRKLLINSFNFDRP